MPHPTGMTRTMWSYRAPQTPSGFTLIEMLIVTSLLGLIALMSVGQISNYVRERNVSSAAAVVRNDLQQAFAIAARNRRPVRLSFTTADTALKIDRKSTRLNSSHSQISYAVFCLKKKKKKKK